MRVSVVIPVFNGARTVARALESVLNQTRAPDEIVVVNDGSTDSTAAELARFGAKIRVLSQSNAGLPAARNAGVRESTGDLIAFLDADDRWLPTKLHKQISLFERSPQIGLVHCGYLDITPTMKPLRAVVDGASGWVAADMINYRSHVILGGGSAMLVSRRAFDAIGGFDESLPFVEDWDFWLRLALRFRVEFVPEVLMHYEVRSRRGQRNMRGVASAMIRVFDKAFADPTFPFRDTKTQAYSNLHMGLATFYLRESREPWRALPHMARALRLSPSNGWRIIRFPWRLWNQVRDSRRVTRDVLRGSSS